MRDAFANEMKSLVEKKNNVVLLSGDIGNRMFDRLKNTRPEQFINCGIAEANMMSMAAGMALSGMRPVIYTITPFATVRCLEQIRIGVAYHQAPVVIVGTGSGLSYSELGPTHHSLEDMAIIRTIPNINVLAPADKIELVCQLREAIESPTPTYIRIGKKGEPDLSQSNYSYGIGKANILREGKKYLLLGVGPIIGEALSAAELLQEKGIDLCVASMGGVAPLDTDFLEKMIAENFTEWITLEEHGIVGGLGTAIIEWLSDTNNSKKINLKRLGVPKFFINKLGNQEYTRNQLEIDYLGIKKQILEL
tara:strand:+ start:2350 stop:3270 length:921 start_codon:yes stop_codon:yes gene_type:complete